MAGIPMMVPRGARSAGPLAGGAEAAGVGSGVLGISDGRGICGTLAGMVTCMRPVGDGLTGGGAGVGASTEISTSSSRAGGGGATTTGGLGGAGGTSGGAGAGLGGAGGMVRTGIAIVGAVAGGGAAAATDAPPFLRWMASLVL